MPNYLRRIIRNEHTLCSISIPRPSRLRGFECSITKWNFFLDFVKPDYFFYPGLQIGYRTTFEWLLTNRIIEMNTPYFRYRYRAHHALECSITKWNFFLFILDFLKPNHFLFIYFYPGLQIRYRTTFEWFLNFDE